LNSRCQQTPGSTEEDTVYGASVTNSYEAELAYRRERMINEFRAVNAAARRRAERRARRVARSGPGPVLKWIRVHQHATR